MRRGRESGLSLKGKFGSRPFSWETTKKSATAPLQFVETKNFRVGSSCVGCDDKLFSGLMDDVAIWNVGLDASQIADLFSGTSPLELPEAGLVSQWVAARDAPLDVLNRKSSLANALTQPVTIQGSERMLHIVSRWGEVG